ncbi:type IV toxin-antitoxin system AbiEi family antitoxin [Bacteroides xylanisolvens]|uniref:type IV toxin-antitoxin system AbiEi family antitoxin n=1 Tax=Bacteroides xylanisolvens TaxID=371601 RepID=UPI0039B579C1
MILIERETLNLALEALKEKFTLPDDVVIHKENGAYGNFDALVQIMNVDFLCKIKGNITATNINTIVNHLQKYMAIENRPVLLVAKYINPNMFDKLVGLGLNILDCAGNCHIRYMNGNIPVFHLINKGEKNVFANEKAYPVFQDAGIKVIFYLLQDKNNINKAYREIQENTGVALGTVKNVIDELVTRNFILVTDKGRILKNRKALLDLWVENYNQVLKPKLLIGRMAFRTNEQRNKWKTMELPEGMYWGGESAANMIDNYLEPGAFDIYTDVPTAYLMKTGFVKQDTNGEIKVYQKFWQWETENHLAPLILIYADLMGSNNSRCLEAANRLMEYGLNDFE